MTRILVVDDELQIARTLALNLRARHYEVAVAHDGGEAPRRAGDWHPDVVVLDLGLPDLDGAEVIHGLRGWTEVPIVVLPGRTGADDKIIALDAGADDYVTKPFGVDELLARIRAVSRRSGAPDLVPAVQVGEHVIDLATSHHRRLHRRPDSQEGRPRRHERPPYPDRVARAAGAPAQCGAAGQPAAVRHGAAGTYRAAARPCDRATGRGTPPPRTPHRAGRAAVNAHGRPIADRPIADR